MSRPDGPIGPDRAWVNTIGAQVIELIAGSGEDPARALRALLLKLERPLSNPPRWCDSGCTRADAEGGCPFLTAAMGEEHLSPLASKTIDWMNAQTWRAGQPEGGITYDCPAWLGED